MKTREKRQEEFFEKQLKLEALKKKVHLLEEKKQKLDLEKNTQLTQLELQELKSYDQKIKKILKKQASLKNDLLKNELLEDDPSVEFFFKEDPLVEKLLKKAS